MCLSTNLITTIFFFNFSLFFPYLNYSNNESSHLPMAFKKAEGLMNKDKKRINLKGFHI